MNNQLSNQLSSDDLVDVLMDLKHDLGKYILLPFSMLPDNASADELREALRVSLHETRKTATGTTSADTIWRRFLDEAEPTASTRPGYAALKQAVENYLALQQKLDAEQILSRQGLLDTAKAVSEMIWKLVEEIEEEK